jgi:glycosyltransferase involved in cell wall biosynthesis
VTSPKFSIVTITLNRRDFLRKAIESVLSQSYENFEHIVIDGGSTDGTVELLKQYAHLRWLSEPDTGQANAMNKGITMLRGDIFGWLNSDDTYPPDAFRTVASLFAQLPSDVAMVYGTCNLVNKGGDLIGKTGYHPFDMRRMLLGFNNINTPAVFLRAKAIKDAGPFDESLKATYDADMWTRIAQTHGVRAIPEPLSRLCLHDGSGLVSTRLHLNEMPLLRQRYWVNRSFADSLFWFNYYRLREWLFYRLKFSSLLKRI